MIQLTDKFWAVEVPDDASKFRIIKFSSPETFSYDYSITRNGKSTSGLMAMVDLPPGSWQYLFTTKGCTEEDARKVVNVQGSGYEDYHDVTPDYFLLPFAKATDSLESLLKAKGCDINKNWAIIQKQTNNGSK